MTHAIGTQALSDALHWRYATKKFDAARKIPADQWRALEEAMVLAPSSFGLQPWRFVVVQNPEIRAQLPSLSWGQTQPVDCSHYVVFAQRKGLSVGDVDHFIDRMVEVRGVTRESLEGYRGFILNFHKAASDQGWLDTWSSRQVYIALGQAMAAAGLLGIDSCPLEGIEPAKYDALLGLERDGYSALCGLAFGYRAEDDKHAQLPKVRFAKTDVVKYV
jgi:nitroreductase